MALLPNLNQKDHIIAEDGVNLGVNIDLPKKRTYIVAGAVKFWAFTTILSLKMFK